MWITCRFSLLGLTLFAVVSGLGQTSVSRPAFEVASVKPNHSGDPHSGTDGWQGRVVFTNLTLQNLIAQAYGVSPFQVTGPAWLSSERFDIEAKYPEGTKQAGDKQQMLLSLLQERFKLTAHLENKEMSGYAIVIAKTGFKLAPSKSDDPKDNDTQHFGGAIQRLQARGTSIATLATLLSRYTGQPVVDKSGIGGQFDFELRWSRDEQNPEAAAPDTPPSIFSALQETLGLKLQAQKVSAEIVVVDHAERTPSEN